MGNIISNRILEAIQKERDTLCFEPVKGTSDMDYQRGYDAALEEIADIVREIDSDYDAVSPNHYKQGSMETIDEMILIFGKDAVIDFCKVNAWKYRARAIYKNGEEDMAKSDYYIEKAKELSE